jgi:uncharacterized protein (TIGR02145 family)
MNEILIGFQTWMTENLNVETFSNGDLISEAKTREELGKLCKENKPPWCYYDNEPKNGTKCGKLYNWYAVNDTRGLAPKDWHVPSSLEWAELSKFLGGDNFSGKKLKYSEGWSYNGKAGNGTNQSGFSALPGGYLANYSGWVFENIGRYGCWWSSTEKKMQQVGLALPYHRLHILLV